MWDIGVVAVAWRFLHASTVTFPPFVKSQIESIIFQLDGRLAQLVRAPHQWWWRSDSGVDTMIICLWFVGD